MKKHNRRMGAVYLATAASIWGSMYVVSKVVLQVIPPLPLVWLRFAVALLALVTVGWIARVPWRIRRRDWPLVAAIGVVGYVVSIWMQFLGTQLSSAQAGAVITSATPAFMAIFGRILLGERLTRRKALSVLLATLGVLLIVGVGHLGATGREGAFALIVAALTWALMSVLVKRIPGEYSQIAVTAYAMAIATILLTPLAWTQMTLHEVTTGLSPLIWAGVLYLGVVSTAVAFFLWNKGLQLLDAGSGGLYFFFQPLVGTFLGWILLGEQIGAGFFIGATFILTAVALVMKE